MCDIAARKTCARGSVLSGATNFLQIVRSALLAAFQYSLCNGGNSVVNHSTVVFSWGCGRTFCTRTLLQLGSGEFWSD